MDALKIASGASEKRKRPCKAATGQRINEAVLNAQKKILGEYIEPGPRDCEQTINNLLDILDDQKVAEVVERSYALKLREAQIISQKKNGGAFRRSRAATTCRCNQRGGARPGRYRPQYRQRS